MGACVLFAAQIFFPIISHVCFNRANNHFGCDICILAMGKLFEEVIFVTLEGLSTALTGPIAQGLPKWCRLNCFLLTAA